MGVYGRENVLVRICYLAVALVWWVCTGFGRAYRGGAVILCYHAVTREQRERFEKQMSVVGKRAIDLDGVGGAAGRRGPAVVCTFDDAFACLLENALPMMKSRGIPARVYVVTDNLGAAPKWWMRPGHPETGLVTMDAGQISGAEREGLARFGSHTATHANLGLCDDAAAERELRRSREEMMRIMGREVDDVALPYGGCTERTLEIARRAGYRRVLTLEPLVEHGVRDGGVLGRFRMTPDVWPIEFRLTIDGAYSWQRVLPVLRGMVRGGRATPTAAVEGATR